MKISDERILAMNTILRIFNKNYNNAIPFEIRQKLGLETGDLLSYSITDAGDVLIHKIPIENSAPQNTGNTPSVNDPIIALLGTLTPEQRIAAITYLSIQYGNHKDKAVITT